MKQSLRTTTVTLMLFCAAQLSHAQGAQVYLGMGTATDSSSGRQVDTFGTGKPYTTPRMGGSFMDFGASLLPTKHFGAGMDISWRATHAAYAGLQYMPIFYSFDGIWVPLSTKRFEPELRAGIGGMKVRFSYNQQECNPISGCSKANVDVATSGHFQVHFATAARFYLSDHVFLRPALEGHYVPNLFQFGSDLVPEYSLGLGYSFGRE